MNKVETTAGLLASNPNITAKQLAAKLKVKISYAYVLLSKGRAKLADEEQLFKTVHAVTSGLAKARAAQLSPISTAEELSPLNMQVGGEHYKTMAIQPVQFITENNLGFLEGCIIKRISRWRSKDGLKDLLKIKHEVDLLIALNHLED
jgi:hypothetical protein